MSRLTLERYQVWAYLIAIGLGLAVGTAWPGIGPVMETLLWPTLAALLFATFLQVPLLHVRDALRDRRFAGAVLLGNFVLLPLLAWALVEVFDFDPVVRLGVLLVLLVPCTDWFITFQFAHAYARGEGMKHYVNMVQEPEFAAREKGYTFVSHQQEVGAGYFDDVTTVIQGGSSSVKALTGSTEEEQFH